MGSGYDEVAKAIATNVPRRKILKLLAGGVAASIGTALVGGTAAAKPSLGFYIVNQTETCEPIINQTSFQQEPGFNCYVEETYKEAIPWWSAFYPGRQAAIGINGTFSK
jgi:hypothetical protein